MIKIYLSILLFAILPYFLKSQTWHSVGNFTNQGSYPSINDIKNINSKLYVFGSYTKIEENTIEYVSVFDGNNWNAVGTGFQSYYGHFNCVFYYDNKILVSGELDINSYQIRRFACWDGTTWGLFNNTTIYGYGYSIESYKNKLYLGGNLTQVFHNNDTITVKRIAEWDGTGWNNMSGGVTGGMGVVYAMVEYNNELIVAGNFYYGGTVLSPFIASWDGTNWHALGNGVDGIVFSLEVDTVNNVLYAGGNFLNADDTIATKYIASWDGNKWRAVGNQTDNYHGINGIRALKVINSELYAGGYGNTGTTSDTLLAKWDGELWYKISDIYNGEIFTIEEYQGNLYVGGQFTVNDTAGNIINGIACYGDSCPLAVNTLKITKEPSYLGNNIPNPTKGTTIIPYKLPEGKEGSIKVYSISGELKQECKLKQGSNQLEIDTLNWQKGTYIYSLFIEGKQVDSKKMVVQ